jgi:shikimate kinase
MLFFLVGFMGSGKSHWGRHWSQIFELNFYDLDEVIEQREGKTIAQLFEIEGEDGFRKKERKALVSLLDKKDTIIACGGGTPCFHDNISRMNESGVTIFLKSPVAELVQRLLPELGHRPVLAHATADTLPSFIEQKLVERAPYYSRCMYHFNTTYLTDENFRKVLDTCKKHS